MAALEHYFVVKAIRTPAGIEWAIDSETAGVMFDGALVWDPDGDGELGPGTWMMADDNAECYWDDEAMIADLAQRLYILE